MPMVVLIVGGGLLALRRAAAACREDRPIIVFVDVPGASCWIHRACVEPGGVLRMRLEDALANGKQVTPTMTPTMDGETAARSLQRAARRMASCARTALLRQIRQKCASKPWMIQPFRCNDEGSAPLSETILEALLNDCQVRRRERSDPRGPP